MNKLSPLHKKILNSLAEIYAIDSIKGTSKYFSKKKLREILICFKWNKKDAVNAIEKGHCDYWWSDD